MLDRYVIGTVNRISPEAPVPIVEWSSEDNRLGGAGNVAVNVASLGGKAFLCGIIGSDSASQLFKEAAQNTDIDMALVLESDTKPTTVKTRIMANDQQLLRLDQEQIDEIDVSVANRFIEMLESFLKVQSVDVCILQDYNKGLLTAELIERLLAIMKEKGVPVAVDPKFNNFWKYCEVALFKPNLKEMKDALPFRIGSDKDHLQKAQQEIEKRMAVDRLLLTLSEQGLYMGEKYKAGAIYPTKSRQVADVCGAGDAVIAITAMSLALGLENEAMAMLANLAGGQVVEKVGVVPVDKDQLREEFNN